MTMAVKVRENASSFPRRASEVDGKHSSPRLQNPSYLPGALLACFARQMMKHQCAQHSVELSVGKWQRLGAPILKATSTAAFLAFFAARAIISGEASMPYTVPVGPTRRLAAIARVPVPQPTSRTDSPVQGAPSGESSHERFAPDRALPARPEDHSERASAGPSRLYRALHYFASCLPRHPSLATGLVARTLPRWRLWPECFTPGQSCESGHLFMSQCRLEERWVEEHQAPLCPIHLVI
jgi:hypothetical protein